MTKIIFKFGAMNSGKSLELIKVAHNYKERGMETIALKPITDSRVQGNEIYSRTGLTLKCEFVDWFILDNKNVNVNKVLRKTECILVDECNFLTKEEVEEIIDIAYRNEVKTLIFFGLMLDFTGHMFEGSKRVVELADKLEENTSVCWCGKKTRKTARVINGQIATHGETIIVEKRSGNEATYVPLCNYHYHTKDLGENEKYLLCSC